MKINILSHVKRFTAVIVFLTLIIPTNASADSIDPVIEWNRVLLNLVKTDKTTPPAAARHLAIMHISMYEAVNSVEQTYHPYHAPIQASQNASTEAAAVSAAHSTLIHLYPNHAETLNNFKNNSLAGLPDNSAKDEGLRVGREAAKNILLLREGDKHAENLQYTTKNKAGYWEPTPPDFAPPLYPHWGSLAPFSNLSLKQFWPPGPPALDSERYAEELWEVKLFGAKDSSHRTADQLEIAHFWEDGTGTFTPPGHWNAITQDIAIQHGQTLAENARLFALLNIAMADASILCWDIKYAFDFWRPVTAIRHADKDGNPLTQADPHWEPLLNTPPFPEYTSGHSTFSGAASVVLASFFGDNVSFTTSYSIAHPHLSRSFNSFSHAAEEAALSRLYGGIHFRSGNDHGLATGQELGLNIVNSMLRPEKKDARDTIYPAASSLPAPTAISVPLTAETGMNLFPLAFSLIGLGGLLIFRNIID